jgi:hypothetical protein
MGAALRICPGCTRPVGPGHDCTARRRHDPVRTTRMPPQAAATRAAAVVRAIDDCRQDVDDATRAHDALRSATRALGDAADALVRRPSAEASLRLQHAEEGVLRATDGLRRATGVGR